jgi:hypothetical protein
VLPQSSRAAVILAASFRLEADGTLSITTIVAIRKWGSKLAETSSFVASQSQQFTGAWGAAPPKSENCDLSLFLHKHPKWRHAVL